MLTSLAARIRRLHWGWQIPAWLAFGLAWLITKIVVVSSRVIGWVAKELGSRATSRAKKLLAPLLWPAVGLAVLVAFAVSAGPQGLQLVLQQVVVPLFTLALVCTGLWIMIRAPFIAGKTKKKKKK